MTTRTYGILAGVLGSAIGAWWWTRQRAGRSTSALPRGTVIYHNTPTPTPLSAEGIV